MNQQPEEGKASFRYCQWEIENEDNKCEVQCEHCKTYYGPLEIKSQQASVDVFEQWANIVGYEGLYQVSDLGNVRRIYKSRTTRLLKKFFRDRYLSVGLSKNNKVKFYDVHVLVATYFVPNPDNKKTVNHKKGNKLLNAATDLEWATRSEQILHAVKIGLFKPIPPTKKGDKLSKETRKKMSESRIKYLNTQTKKQ